MTKCLECGDEINPPNNTKKPICTPCSPNRLTGFGPYRGIKLTNIQIWRLQRAAGISQESWLSSAIKDLKVYFQNPIKTESRAITILDAVRNLTFDKIESIPELCEQIYQIRFGNKSLGKIEKLRESPDAPVDWSFSVPSLREDGDENFADEFYILIKWYWLPGIQDDGEKCLYINIESETSYLNIPSIGEVSFVLDDKDISSEIYDHILKIIHYQQALQAIISIKNEYVYVSGEGFLSKFRNDIYFVFKKHKIRNFFLREIEGLKFKIYHNYIELCRKAKKKIKNDELYEIEKSELEYFYYQFMSK